MKQGKIVSGLVMVLVIAVVSYMAYYIFQAMSSPLKTAEAVLFTAEETVSVNGYFMRDELLVSAGGGEVQEIRVSEGDKVAKGEVLFVGYDNSDVRQLRYQLEDVESRLLLLKDAVGGGSASDIKKVDQNISEHLIGVIYGVEQPKSVDFAYESEQLKASVLERGLAYSETGGQEAATAIDELTKEQSRLSKQADRGVASVRSPDAGFFSSAVDGYEGILTLQKADEITLDELIHIEAQQSTESAEPYCGRLATGFEWRFAVVVPTKYAERLSEGSRITLRFTGDYIGDVNVAVRRIGEDTDGQCIVVFACSTNISDLLGLRCQNADIVFSTYEGVRIPKEALRMNESGETGVYCLVAMQAKFVKTEQIYETDQAYIVRYDPSSTAGLRPGDAIIVSSKNLYDGKIVQ